MNLLSIVVCLIQMTTMMLVAGLLARWLRPRMPESATVIGLVGLLASLALMLLTVINAPRPFESQVIVPTAAKIVQIGSHGHSESVSAVAPSFVPTPAKRPVIGISLRDAFHAICAQSLVDQPQSTSLVSWIGYAWIGMVVVSILPIALGLIGTIQIHRQSNVVDSESAKRLRSIANLKPGADLEFRSSKSVGAPCITLYGGRSIYMPDGWTRWSETELSAAVAHEAAHLDHGDPWKRLTGQLAASLQCFHPFAIWLCRGISLSQEMAADRDAAAVQGEGYTRSLSRIALRMDASCDIPNRYFSLKQWFMRPGIVSVSSSHLIRRIEMLTKHPVGRSSRKFRIVSHLALVALLATCTSWTVRADQPNNEENVSGNTHHAARVASLPRRDADVTKPFARKQTLPWDELSPNDSGFVSVDVDKLLSHPSFGLALPGFVDPYLDMVWKAIVKDAASSQRTTLGLATLNVKRVVATLNYSMSKTEAVDGADSQNTVTFGTGGGKMWYQQPVSHDALMTSLDPERIAAILKDNGTTVEDIGGQTHVEFVTSFLSKIFTEGASTAHILVPPPEAECDERQFDCLRKSWHAVDGGAITACYTLPDTLGFIENEEDAFVEMVLKSAACMSVGFDFGSDGGPADVRLAMVPRRDVSPLDLQGILQNLIDAGESKFDEMMSSDDTDEDAMEAVTRTREILSTLRMQTADSTGGDDQDCIVMTFRMPLETFMLFMQF